MLSQVGFKHRETATAGHRIGYLKTDPNPSKIFAFNIKTLQKNMFLYKENNCYASIIVFGC